MPPFNPMRRRACLTQCVTLGPFLTTGTKLGRTMLVPLPLSACSLPSLYVNLLVWPSSTLLYPFGFDRRSHSSSPWTEQEVQSRSVRLIHA